QNAVEQNTSTVSIDDVNTVDSVNSNQVDENNLGSAEGQDKVSAGEYGTFTELQNLIDNNDVVNLTKNYMWDISFNSGSKTGIYINKQVVINGNGYTIDGDYSSRLFNITGNVTFNNVIFTNCGPDKITNENSLGGCIYAGRDSEVKLLNCDFKDLYYDRPDLTTGPRIIGMAIYSVYSKILMENCTSYGTRIRSDSVPVQALIFSSTSEYYINNCSLDEQLEFSGPNGATSNLTVKNSDIYNLTLMGGGTNSTILNSNFEKFGAIKSNAWGYLNFKNCTCGSGGFYLLNFGNLQANISDSTFYDSQSSGLYLDNGGMINVDNCYFINNNAVEGGGMYVGDYVNVTLSNLHFIDNSAIECGGGLFIGQFANATLGSIEFINNTAGIDGNDSYTPKSDKIALFVGPDTHGKGTGESDPASIKYAFNNIKEGGTIYFVPGIYATSFTLTKSVTLIGIDDGVIFTEWTQEPIKIAAPNVEMRNFIFTNRTIHALGSTIYSVLDWEGDNGKLINCSFINTCIYKVNVGNLYWNGANGLIDECKFINCSCYYSVSGYGNAGALAVYGANLTVKNSKFYNNSARAGSAIYCFGKSNTTVENCVFSDNVGVSANFAYAFKQNNLTIRYARGDIKLNAITNVTTANITFRNVSYWEDGQFKNTDIDGYSTNISGYAINVKFYEKVSGNYVFEETHVTDANGRVFITNIPPQYYNVVISHFTGPTRSINKSLELAYGKKISKLDLIYSNNINPGDDLIVVANLNETATGNVTFTLNNQTYVRNISDGQAVLTLKAYNLVGLYKITALYSGDSTYYPQNNEVTLAITPVLTSNVVISNDDVVAAGDTVTLTGKVNFNIVNGVLQFVIKSDNDVVVVNGTRGIGFGVWNANYKFTQTGNYVISAQYYGINLDVTEGSVTVRDISQINVSADTIDYKQDAIIKFTVPVNATGVITLTVGDNYYTITLN
ncbi:MAG: hypothetical protein E7Z80_09700, partial [Methanobrevibacter thaueri]|nr:hypothetical protein [Methanobrevibacter thaueri]